MNVKERGRLLFSENIDRAIGEAVGVNPGLHEEEMKKKEAKEAAARSFSNGVKQGVMNAAVRRVLPELSESTANDREYWG